MEQTLHEKSCSILKEESDLFSQLHCLANDILQLRKRPTAFMSHAGYRPQVCNSLEGNLPNLDLGRVPLNKRLSMLEAAQFALTSTWNDIPVYAMSIKVPIYMTVCHQGTRTNNGAMNLKISVQLPTSYYYVFSGTGQFLVKRA